MTTASALSRPKPTTIKKEEGAPGVVQFQAQHWVKRCSDTRKTLRRCKNQAPVQLQSMKQEQSKRGYVGTAVLQE